MNLSVLLTTLLVNMLCNSEAQDVSTYYKNKVDLHGYEYTMDLLFETSVVTKVTCGTLCSSRVTCSSFTFTPSLRSLQLPKCRGHSSQLTSATSDQRQSSPGTKVYVKRDVDGCISNPCQNAGLCRSGNNSYSCACSAGYTGSDCQTDIDECDADPCLNRGTCSDGVNSYSCKCPVKYIGNDCETDTCPNSESFNYVERLHYCFKVFTNTVNHWDNAINNCQQQGLELAILETDAKLSAVRQTIIGNAAYSNADTSYYIGGSLPREMWGDSTLTDHDYTQFFWLDGTRVNTSMWANGEPDGRGEDHVMALYKHSFYIFDRPSTRSYGYVCQKNL